MLQVLPVAPVLGYDALHVSGIVPGSPMFKLRGYAYLDGGYL